ncbi:hypothetical protein MKMG_01885 [Methanogenium sp. MK-MG]|nr:hypothetical protein MKMG_01885 [Methanogenium sp. MK-MG]
METHRCDRYCGTEESLVLICSIQKDAWEQEQHYVSLYETNKILTQWKEREA